VKFKIANFLFQYVPLLGIAVIMIVLPATRSRSSWLAVLVGSIVILIYKYGILKRINSWGSIKRIWGAIIVIIILVFSLYGVYHFKKGSADGRMLIWKVSTNIIKENPVFGVGFDRFKAHYMDAQAEYFRKESRLGEGIIADNTYYAFNEPLQFTVENGILGMIFLSVIIFLLARISVEEHIQIPYLKIVGLSICSTVLVFGLFSYPTQILPIKMIGLVAMALIATIDAKKNPVRSKESNGLSKGRANWIPKTFICSICATLIWTAYPLIKKVGQGYRDWKTAMDTYNYRLYQESIVEFKRAWPVLHKDGEYLMNYGKALAMAGEHKSAIEILDQAKYHLNTTIIETTLGDAHKTLGHYKKAEVAYQRAANMIPHRFYPQYLLAKLYIENGEEEKAKTKAREILDKEIKVPSKAIREIRSEMERILRKSPGIQ
jgi:hypothetical protein